MFNTKSNVLKLSKKKYSNIMKNKYKSSYLIHERISNNINHSTASANLDTTASRSSLTRSYINSYRKIPVNDKEKNLYKIKKCSYTDFLAVRDSQMKVPFNYTEERFKWQNIYDEHSLVDPLITTKSRKKQFLLKETFVDKITYTNNNKPEKYKPKIRRLRRSNSDENGKVGNYVQNVDIDISRRVINPEYNKEKEIISKKKAFSQNNYIYHKTNGNLESLFKLTPNEIPIKGKRLFKHKSCKTFSINIFDSNYGRYEYPTHTKRQFFNNNCYLDHIKEQNLISVMNKCWKIRKSRSSSPGFRTDLELFLNKNVNTLKLRNQETHNYRKIEVNKNNNKTERCSRK